MKNKCEKSFLKDGDMEKINRYSARELNENEVYVFTATLCDNDIDRDYEKFSVAALNELAKLFTGKTVIADHSMKSGDQRARIFETYVEKQDGILTADGEPLFALKGRAYMLKNESNQTLIDEIEAGIIKEGSVSCSMGRRTCSVCGKDKSKEHCEHIASKKYGGRLCYTILDDAADAYEFSFVAVPAQKRAGVTKKFTITEDMDMNDIMKTIKGCGESGVSLSKAQARELGSYIEQLEDEAKLGDVYKKELSKTVLGLLKAKLPELDTALLKSVVSVMTAEELTGFKRGLERQLPPVSQLTAKNEKSNKRDNSQFKI